MTRSIHPSIHPSNRGRKSVMGSGEVRISPSTEGLSSDERAPEKNWSGGEIGRTKSGKLMKKKKTPILPLSKFGCFRSDYGVSTVERSDINGNLDMESAAGGRNCRPNHLVVMVNGIIGSAKDWRYAAKQFLKKYPNDIIVHCSKRNHTTQTFKGVDIMGMRLADEVLTVVENYPNLEKISFVGHSLGGLIARYALAKLYTKAAFEDEEKGKVAGLEPVNFITFATPHLGCRGHKQAPAFCGSYAMEKAAARVSGILGRSGKHLFLKDGSRHGLPPLLIQMTKDIDNLPFMSSLQSFPRRVAYANARFDFLVGWSTASLRLQHELPKRRTMTINESYPHILELGGGSVKTVDYQEKKTTILAQVKRSKTANMEEEMMKGLSKLRWERVDVDFGKSTQRIMAHNTIQVQNYSMHSDGADVIQHMIDNFML